MASYTPYANLRQEIGTETYNVNTTLNDNWTKIDSIFDPTGSPAAGAPKAFLRETAVAPTYTTAAKLINLTPTWNGAAATLYGIFLNVSYSAAEAASRAIAIQRSNNTIFDVDITTQVAVNGISIQGGATAAPAVIKAVGTDANVSISLVPKGSGSVLTAGSVSVTGSVSATQGFQTTTGAAAFDALWINSSPNVGFNAVRVTTASVDGAGGDIVDIANGTGTAFILDNKRNVGFGASPHAGWAAARSAIQVGVAGSIWSRNDAAGSLVLHHNSYLDSALAYRSLAAGIGVRLSLSASGAYLGIAPAVAAAGDLQAYTDALIIDANRNLGLGAGPSAWSGATALQFGTDSLGSLFRLNGQNVTLGFNTYYAGGHFAVATSGASRITLDTGIQFGIAPSVTAGNGQTFYNPLSIADGLVSLGSNAGAKVDFSANLGASSTAMTSGFIFIPCIAGPPTGAPTNSRTENAALVYDYLNNRLYVRDHVGAEWLYKTIDNT